MTFVELILFSVIVILLGYYIFRLNEEIRLLKRHLGIMYEVTSPVLEMLTKFMQMDIEASGHEDTQKE